MPEKGKVFFVGAGPGDPELITLRGKRLLEDADVIVYVGSLLNPEILKFSKQGAKLYDSAAMSLEEVIKIMVDAAEKGEKVVRLHDGDPSLYGAIKEQMDLLAKEGIEYELVPGVSSLQAAAATLKLELTLPGVSQTVIITRPGGRTSVMEAEDLIELARHKVTMAIFLGIHAIDNVVEKLRLGGYPENTPVAVVYKASWREEKIVEGVLNDISKKVREAGIKSMALILVGEVLDPKSYNYSKLYNSNFTHSFRKGRKDV
jgi:precorrin-4/cobalt-precorrin-4 C11-methyltransferase